MNTKLIEDFLAGKLSENEKLRAEKQIESDKTLADDMAFVVATKQMLHTDFAQNKKAEWKNLYKKTDNRQFIILKALAYVGSAAAAAACLIFVVYQAFVLNDITSKTYVQTYVFKNYTNLSTQMGDEDDSRLAEVIALYNTQQYEDVLGILKTLKETPKTLEYRGLAEFQLKQYTDALGTFRRLEPIETSALRKAPFFEAITLIQLNREEEAKEILEKIIATPHFFGQKEAQELLELSKK